MIRLLQLEHFDAPWLLAGETKPRAAAWSKIPYYYGIELLWKCANCFAADGNSGPSLPVNSPTADALRVVALLNNKTTDPAG